MTIDEARQDIVNIIEMDGIPIDPHSNKALDDLIAAVRAEQYDAIMAAVRNAPVVIRLDTYAMYATILDAIAQHDPRKGAE